MESPAQVLWLRRQSTRIISGQTQVRLLWGPFTREIFYRKEMAMFKKLMEIVTAFGALFLLSGVDSSIWCGILGLALLVLFRLEAGRWEGDG